MHFGGGEGDAVKLEIAGFLHFAVGDRDMGDDGFADVFLPDAHGAGTVLRHFGGVNQAVGNGKRADGGGEVAAVAAPVYKRFVDGNLAE